MGSSVDCTIIYSKERAYKYETERLCFFMAPCLQRLKDYAHTALLSYLRGMIHNARSLMSACVASRRALDPSRLRRCGAFLKTQGVERHHRSSDAAVLLHTSASKLREAQTRSSFADDLIGLLGGLVDEGLVDVGDHTTAGDGRLDEGVELLVTTDGELKVAGGDALDLR